jgi:hypothetical protein
VRLRATGYGLRASAARLQRLNLEGANDLAGARFEVRMVSGSEKSMRESETVA